MTTQEINSEVQWTMKFMNLIRNVHPIDEEQVKQQIINLNCLHGNMLVIEDIGEFCMN